MLYGNFGTPFEAAAWAVLSQRVQMAQAAKVKHELARQLGADGHLDGRGARGMGREFCV